MANRKFDMSQKAHAILRRKWMSKGNTDKSRAYGNYHADCYNQQNRQNRILSKAERKKLFKYWWSDDVENKRTKYPF